MEEHHPSPVWSVCYWILVGLLLLAPLLLAFTIFGLPLALVGAVMAVLFPFRRHPYVFWPPIIALVTFIAGVTVVAPLSCSTSSMSVASVWVPSQATPATFVTPVTGAIPVKPISGETIGRTNCSNLAGMRYSGPGNYQPSFLPALLVGLLAAAALGPLARYWLHRRERARQILWPGTYH